MMKATIRVRLKPGILDPQGRAVMRSLDTLGFSTVHDVRVGKVLEIELTEHDPAKAEAHVKAMCDALLVNPAIEHYDMELHPQAPP